MPVLSRDDEQVTLAPSHTVSQESVQEESEPIIGAPAKYMVRFIFSY